MKKIILMIFLGSIAYSQISFNKSICFSQFEDDVVVTQAMGVDFSMNDAMSVGYDTNIGMLVKASIKDGIKYRIGYGSQNGQGATLGFEYNWSSVGEGIKTSIGTAFDYTTAGSNLEQTTVRINLGWGF